MKISNQSCLPWALAALVSLVSLPALAQSGPGLGNLDCGDAEYFKPFSFIENDSGPKGTNVSVIVGGYFVTIFTPDSGHPPGEIGIFDLSNPKAPKEVRHIENADTTKIREAHSLPVAIINDKYYIAIQTISGIQFWDFTDPPNAQRVGNIDLPGVNGGDYENVAWQTSWQGRYLYVSGGNQGIYVVDAANPLEPRLLKQVSTSTTGGFRVGPLFALGDYMVTSNMDQGGAYSILDISVPDAPALISRVGNMPRMYAITVGGDRRIYSAGRDGNFLIHQFTDPTKIVEVKNAMIGQDQLYAAAQDDFVFLGRQNNVVKVDVTDEQNPKVVGEGTLGRGNPDHGQVTPMGNLIFIGNDHGTGSALFCHQRGQDKTPPRIEFSYPESESTGVAPSSRISVLFSDFIDVDTIREENVLVRAAGGEALKGIFTYAFNTLSFSPETEFAADTTYELVLTAGGVKDVMGNGLAEEKIVRFSTGDEIIIPEPPPPEPEEPLATGGDGGLGGGTGGAGTGGAGTGGVDSMIPGTGGQLTGSGGGPVGGTAQDQGGCAFSPRLSYGNFAGFGVLILGLAAARRRLRRA